MKRSRTTLKNFINNFNVENFVEKQIPIVKLSDLSYDEKYKLYKSGYLRQNLIVSKKDDHIYYAIKNYSIARAGRCFYINSTITSSIFISLKEINIKCNPDFIASFLEKCGITWIKDVVFSELTNKSIFKSILIGTIYNQETYYKAIAKRVYHYNFEWKTIREIYNKHILISLSDIRDFTTNPENSLKAYINAPSCTIRTLMQDLLRNAVSLNQMVNFCWSEKRMNVEHNNQNNLLLAQEISAKDVKEIYENIIPPVRNFKLLNTEADIFAEGFNMHHCLYNCYYRDIKNHDYIAYHISYPEDCTLGIFFKHGKPTLNQIYAKFDIAVKPETKLLAEKFIKDNSELLIKMRNKKDIEYLDIDLPF